MEELKSGHMTKVQRLEFMRKRFKVVRNFPPLKPRQPVIIRVGSYYRQGTLSVSVDQHTREMQAKWVYMAKRPAPVLPLKPRRTARKSALTRIAEQLPAKLPRVLF